MLETIGVDDAPRHVRVMLQDTYVSLSVPAVQAAEFADEVTKPALSRVRETASELAGDGRSAHWVFNPANDEHLQGAAYVLVGVDGTDVVAAKNRFREVVRGAATISALDPLQFEALCRVVLRQIGVTQVGLTPYRADQGLDFYGRLGYKSALAEIEGYPPILDKLTMWVVGQAKHYPSTQVATFDLRELVGSVTLARAKAFGLAGDRYPDLDMKTADPVISLFITSGQISKEARLLARHSGVLAVDGQALVHLLAHAGVGFSDDGEFKPHLLEAAVREETLPTATVAPSVSS